MKMSFRWYGKNDPVSLQYISQIPGMKSIVSAVYDVKPGEVWPEEVIEEIHRKVSTTDPESGYFHKGEHKKVFAYTAGGVSA